METACNYTDKTMYVSTDERWLINRLLEFKELYPEEIHIILKIMMAVSIFACLQNG